MFKTHARDLIHSATKDEIYDNKKLNIYYEILNLRKDKKLMFIFEQHLFNGALHTSAFTLDRASLNDYICGDNNSLMLP